MTIALCTTTVPDPLCKLYSRVARRPLFWDNSGTLGLCRDGELFSHRIVTAAMSPAVRIMSGIPLLSLIQRHPDQDMRLRANIEIQQLLAYFVASDLGQEYDPDQVVESTQEHHTNANN